MSMAKNYWQTRGYDRTDTENPRDFYPTPEHVTKALLQRERFAGSILEPASGNGAMSSALRLGGYKVEEADLDRGQDFLRRTRPCWNVVTNPPYGKGYAEKFVRQALELARCKVAMLLPFYFLEGVCRHDLFHWADFPLKAVYVFSRRPTFGDHRHYAPFGTVWAVWSRTHKGKAASLKWVA